TLRVPPMHDSVLTRRAFVAGCAVMAVPTTSRAQTPLMAEDGLYHQPWFLQSFLDLREDFHTTMAAGKLFVFLWELRNCPYCKLLHTVNFAHPDIVAYAKEHFTILQLNLIGSRPVKDFGGVESSEKALANKWEVNSTPTLQFFIEAEKEHVTEAG